MILDLAAVEFVSSGVMKGAPLKAARNTQKDSARVFQEAKDARLVKVSYTSLLDVTVVELNRNRNP